MLDRETNGTAPRRLRRICTALLLALASCHTGQPDRPEASEPPKAVVRPVTDDYFGARVVDPYRYLEDLNDPEVQSWMKGQDAHTRSVLAGIRGREELLARIVELDESTPDDVQVLQQLPDGGCLYSKLCAKEEIPKVYWRRRPAGTERLLADPERIELKAPARKGRNSFASCVLSDDGRYLAVVVLRGGAEDAAELHVIETASGRETGDVITRVSAQLDRPCWLPDNRRLAYARLRELSRGAPATERQQKSRSYVHVLGSDQEQDAEVFGYGVVPSIDVDPRHFGSVRTSPGCAHALGVVDTGVSPNLAWYVEPVDAVGSPAPGWRKVADFVDDVSSCAVHGDDLYLLTYKAAPHYKVVRTDARKPDLASAVTIVPAGDAVLTSIHAARDALYVLAREGGTCRLLRVGYDRTPVVESLALPFAGTVSEIRADPRVTGIMFSLCSWTHCDAIYAFDPEKAQVTDTGLQVPGPHDVAPDLEADEVTVRSHDGVMVPLSIVHRRGMEHDGSTPMLLIGYGAYGVSQSPFFERVVLAWLERGCAFAVCHARGGGELGEEWHLAGKGATKPNTWRDFIACAEYLVARRITSPARLAGMGGSAGGILIGRAITERPDLFAAAVIQVGILDMLRVETTSNGVPNIAEFGSTATKEGFDALLAMSSYHHVIDGTRYPAVLLTTGINDPRVDPWEPGKMAARLQAATTSGKPVLLRVDYGGGHGGGSGRSQALAQMADTWAFLLWQLGASPP